jgi:hypothetical protein
MNIGDKFLAVTDVTVKPETQKLKKKLSNISRSDMRPYS